MGPLIGITTSNYVSPATGWHFNRGYVGCIQAIAEAGGLPVLIPVSVDAETRQQIYQRLDGLLLSGGEDINPTVYGAAQHPATGKVDAERDRAELQLVRWAVEDDLPTLAICRGHQMLNVALGGTLIQDVPSQVQTTINHHCLPRNALAHTVEVDPASRLAAILGTTHLPVNSVHHQSVEQPAPALRVTAYAPDGVLEGTELPDKTFILSVQWHPEDLFREHEVMRRLFGAFIEAARAGRAA
ncbi:MAG: gamma-glutamyl-gamma-aminobutyrate hydrolase family protein [Chloroflexi bacterium]|nr:gamma-glutamyl-gamma-aminobutyrate hydrolase family protein [Chloroflexota bacterium]